MTTLKKIVFEFSGAEGEVIAVFNEHSKYFLPGVREKLWDKYKL